MIFIKRTLVLLLVCCWIASNVDVVWCYSFGDFTLNLFGLFRFILDLITRSKIYSGEYVNVKAFHLKGKEERMEDRHAIHNIKTDDTRVPLFGVFDGHGGEFAAEYAAEHLITELKNRIVSLKFLKKLSQIRGTAVQDFKYETVLNGAIKTVDRNLCTEAKEMNDPSGTTAIVALIDGNQLFVANLGDSRGVMCDYEDNPIPLSDHQKPNHTTKQDKDGNIKEVIRWKSLGDYLSKDKKLYDADPSITTFNLLEHKPKFLMFASNGLWKVFDKLEAIKFILEELNKDDTMFGAENIALEAAKRGSEDNITVLIVRFMGSSIVEN